jgi:hypothetical protein
MTKAKGDHGGKRIGAGRKAKPRAGPTRMAGDSGSPFDTVIPANLSPEERRKFLDGLADETLATIMATGTSESARVAAARETKDRILGKPQPGTAAKSDQLELLADDGWGTLLKSGQSVAGRTN